MSWGGVNSSVVEHMLYKHKVLGLIPVICRPRQMMAGLGKLLAWGPGQLLQVKVDLIVLDGPMVFCIFSSVFQDIASSCSKSNGYHKSFKH